MTPPSVSARLTDLVELAAVAVALGALLLVVRWLLVRRRGGLDTGGRPGPELVLVVLGSAFLAVALRWPLALNMSSHVPAELQDPILQAWHIAWGAHALLTQPLDPFQANVHWPLANSLAYTDGLLGFAPAGLLGRGTTAALAQYNALYLFAYALAFAAAYALARELGARPAAAVVAGAAFAYAPWRIAQENHLNVLSSGGIPLSIFLLIRGYRGQSPGFVLAGWLVAAGQISLGFALGLQSGYLLAALVAVGVGLWLARGRPRPRAPVLAATAGGMALLAAGTLLLAGPYLSVVAEIPEARRSYDRVRELSPSPMSFLTAPAESVLWGP